MKSQNAASPGIPVTSSTRRWYSEAAADGRAGASAAGYPNTSPRREPGDRKHEAGNPVALAQGFYEPYERPCRSYGIRVQGQFASAAERVLPAYAREPAKIEVGGVNLGLVLNRQRSDVGVGCERTAHADRPQAGQE